MEPIHQNATPNGVAFGSTLGAGAVVASQFMMNSTGSKYADLLQTRRQHFEDCIAPVAALSPPYAAHVLSLPYVRSLLEIWNGLDSNSKSVVVPTLQTLSRIALGSRLVRSGEVDVWFDVTEATEASDGSDPADIGPFTLNDKIAAIFTAAKPIKTPSFCGFTHGDLELGFSAIADQGVAFGVRHSKRGPVPDLTRLVMKFDVKDRIYYKRPVIEVDGAARVEMLESVQQFGGEGLLWKLTGDRNNFYNDRFDGGGKIELLGQLCPAPLIEHTGEWLNTQTSEFVFDGPQSLLNRDNFGHETLKIPYAIRVPAAPFMLTGQGRLTSYDKYAEGRYYEATGMLSADSRITHDIQGIHFVGPILYKLSLQSSTFIRGAGELKMFETPSKILSATFEGLWQPTEFSNLHVLQISTSRVWRLDTHEEITQTVNRGAFDARGYACAHIQEKYCFPGKAHYRTVDIWADSSLFKPYQARETRFTEKGHEVLVIEGKTYRKNNGPAVHLDGLCTFKWRTDRCHYNAELYVVNGSQGQSLAGLKRLSLHMENGKKFVELVMQQKRKSAEEDSQAPFFSVVKNNELVLNQNLLATVELIESLVNQYSSVQDHVIKNIQARLKTSFNIR